MTKPTAHADTLPHTLYWHGEVLHSRRSPKKNAFKYQIYMLGKWLDDLPEHQNWVASRLGQFPLLRFCRTDYLPGEGSLRQAVRDKARQLGAILNDDVTVLFIGNPRCLGVYFSPINFYLLMQQQQPRYLLAEVSNTPWGERDYYLIPLPAEAVHTDKAFHVSPFMPMDMQYQWQIHYDPDHFSVGITNLDKQTRQAVFHAHLSLRAQPVTQASTRQLLRRFPAMTLKVVVLIYYQAAKMLLKGFRFYPHP
ncbi:MAG: DUF1365 domain-containing protein [Plesiomonas sp.]|uniref:DUF1365 domain-containing protein n=1 Tax=Plesiomonas sp. TaxID=2486279 RepID=UPI003F39D62F